MRRALACLTASLVLAVPAVAAAPAKVTRNGVGPVKLGATHASLKAKGVLGPQIPGCELAGPGQKAARIKGSIEGAVNLKSGKNRRVKTIVVTDGAAAKGVGFGDRGRHIKARFPNAEFDRSTEEVFGLTLVTVPRSDGGRFQFGIDAKTNKITVMGVPFIAFCE
jgi:hypothetical protein